MTSNASFDEAASSIAALSCGAKERGQARSPVAVGSRLVMRNLSRGATICAMTTREHLHRLVDELSDAEAEDALRIMVARLEDEVSPRIVLSDEEAQRFLHALEDPSAFEPGLRRLVERPRVLGA
jgi:hypothetical protein